METSKYVTLIRKDNPPPHQTVQMNLSQCIVSVKRPLFTWPPSICSLEDKKFPQTVLAILFKRQGSSGLCVAMPKLNIKNVKKALEG